MSNRNRFCKIVSAFAALMLLIQQSPVSANALAPRAQNVQAAAGPVEELMAPLLPQALPATKAATTQAEPDALAQPLSISRVQSSYVAGTTVITLTLTNNLPPTLAPDIPDGATVTATTDILAGFVITADVNTLRNVLMTDTLAAGTTLLAASGEPVQVGSTLTWSLADIPPSGSATITLSLQTPPAGADFVDLDGGAQFSAERWGQAVATTARPSVIVPGGLDPAYTGRTADADLLDGDMLWISAGFAQDPLAAFDHVRGLDYEPYRGSLRGTRGTLWSAAGNSLDQSSLLIAMLRAAGIPARYRHGTLETAAAQTLLTSMFSSPQGVAGYLPDGTELADPVNDPGLLALAQDHWWVEAYLPGSGWTDLDPSFAAASPGDSFATPTTHDRVAAVPGSEQHTVSFALLIEQYSQFPIGGSFLNQVTPLSATLPTARVAGKRVILSQFVTDETPSGAVYASRSIIYQPYLGIEENNQAFLGDPFQDMLSSFPFGTQATTAAWIEYTLTAPDGSSETFRRTIKDTIGASVRLVGGTPNLAFDLSAPPFLTPEEQYVHWVLPNAVPEWAYRRQVGALLPTILDLGQQWSAMLNIGGEEGDPLTAEQANTLVQGVGRSVMANTQSLAISGLDFALQADTALATIESGLRTQMFYSSPRLFAIGTTLVATDTFEANVDLRTTRATAVVAPGQSLRAAPTAQWLKGVVESQLEGAILEQVYGLPAVTAARVLRDGKRRYRSGVYRAGRDLFARHLALFARGPSPHAPGPAGRQRPPGSAGAGAVGRRSGAGLVADRPRNGRDCQRWRGRAAHRRRQLDDHPNVRRRDHHWTSGSHPQQNPGRDFRGLAGNQPWGDGYRPVGSAFVDHRPELERHI